jgi:hypothetical protein
MMDSVNCGRCLSAGYPVKVSEAQIALLRIRRLVASSIPGSAVQARQLPRCSWRRTPTLVPAIERRFEVSPRSPQSCPLRPRAPTPKITPTIGGASAGTAKRSAAWFRRWRSAMCFTLVCRTKAPQHFRRSSGWAFLGLLRNRHSQAPSARTSCGSRAVTVPITRHPFAYDPGNGRVEEVFSNPSGRGARKPRRGVRVPVIRSRRFGHEEIMPCMGVGVVLRAVRKTIGRGRYAPPS